VANVGYNRLVNGDIEAILRAHHDAGRHEEMLTAALHTYSREVMGFLLVRLRDETMAGDVFSILCEDLWRGLAGFTWRSSFRTWMYVLARNAAHRYTKATAAERERHAPLSQISEVAAAARTETLSYLRTEAKDRFAEVRERLDPLERQLLVLRVSRRLSWNEVAAILEGDARLDDAALAGAAARYRQRFRTLKQRLRELAAPPVDE
jgi:RNA polymerase sigma-70 factor, ECF subfamily